MNILFLTLIDFNSIDEKNIYTDLMREFLKNGHKVSIVSPVEKRKNQSTVLIDYENYTILKLKIGNIQKTNIIKKGISTLLLETKFVMAIKRYYKNTKFDLVLYSTPPITLLKAVMFVKKRDIAKTYLMLKDIFPQNAVDLGMINKTGIKSLLFKYLRKKEKNLYALSDYIGCMSQANVDYIIRNNPDLSPNCIEVCPNSIEPIIVMKDEKRIKKIREKYGLPTDKTIFIYGGNLGKPQGIDFLIRCLSVNKTNEQVYFVVIGSGTEFDKVRTFIEVEKPKNSQLLMQLPKNDYEDLVNSCDVGLIFLDNHFTIPNFPSRILSYMQASIPILAATDSSTDMGRIIEKGNFGFWCESSNTDEFSYKLLLLCNSILRVQMGQNARRYMENNYTVKQSYEIIINHFTNKEK